MSYLYEQKQMWLRDMDLPPPISEYVLCGEHADRLTPPLGWILTDQRNSARLFGLGEVA